VGAERQREIAGHCTAGLVDGVEARGQGVPAAPDTGEGKEKGTLVPPEGAQPGDPGRNPDLQNCKRMSWCASKLCGFQLLL
jgi:hypothetical protein